MRRHEGRIRHIGGAFLEMDRPQHRLLPSHVEQAQQASSTESPPSALSNRKMSTVTRYGTVRGVPQGNMGTPSLGSLAARLAASV